ncbi:hypothetical protein I7I53_06267 [Histoplasma capsulatum var. duboisii H88]|uniref:Uncharacterized protein n=1 Tax=Ajellomyces capsulatus (strain H88) TaxID=544711 RepID=A0A8A1LAQ8_AJEC8|nr:hypothetical protein I7I53_06267 [Histoplasma capsulatum var. duboisii H88]
MWHWRGLILSPSFAGSEEGEERRWEDSSLKRRISGGVAESRECNTPLSSRHLRWEAQLQILDTASIHKRCTEYSLHSCQCKSAVQRAYS